MSLPVVIVTSGGLPVTVAANGLGTPMVAAATGLAVTFAASGGLPVVGISSGPPAAPVNIVAPFIVGTPAVGQTLTAATGSWTGSPAPTYTYQWKRGGVNIGGATASAYLLVSADLAAMMTVTVTATNSQGNASATSAAVGPVAAGATAPVNTVLPVIDDTTPEVGQVLTATSGTWTGTPTITYAYQWVRGITAVLPVNTVAPAVTGTTEVGSTLTTTNGTWTGTPTPTYARQWKRGGVAISGETALTYLLAAPDNGTMITCTVTATNTAGSVDATSNSVGPITTPAAGDADVTAWVAVVGSGNVTAGRRTALDTFVGALKTAGVWAKLDRYWLLAGENTTSALVDLKARLSCTVAGTPGFVASQGYITSAANNVTTGYIPSSSGPNMTVNSATYGCFVNTNRTVAGNTFEFGASNGAFDRISGINIASVGTTGTDAYTQARVNCAGTLTDGEYTSATNRGSWLLTRKAASGTDAVLQYYNGSSAGFPNPGSTSTTASTGLPDVVVMIGGLNLGGTLGYHSGARISSFYVGGTLTPAEVTAFYNAERTLMTAVGLA